MIRFVVDIVFFLPENAKKLIEILLDNNVLNFKNSENTEKFEK